MARQIQTILTSIILATTSVAAGTDNSSRTTTLDGIVSEALTRNPELDYFRAAIDVAKGERRTAVSYPNPEFSGQAGAKHSVDSQTGETGTGLAIAASISQPIEYSSRRALRKAIADHQIELAELGYAQFRTTLAAATRAAAYSIVIAQQNATAATEVANRFRGLGEVLHQREVAGVGPALEVSLIDAQAASADRRANEAKLKVSTALIKLNQLRGRPFSAPANMAATDLSFRPPEPNEKLMSLALQRSFELRVRQAELAQQGLRVSLARNEKYPTFSVGPFYSHEQSGKVGEKQDIAGVAMSLPLPLWNQNKGNIASAQARQRQAEASFGVSRREVERKTAENAAIYASKATELARWESKTIDRIREAATAADEHYRSGAIPLITYVEIQKQYLESLDGVLEAKTEALEAAQELEILTGLRFFKSESGQSREARP